MSGDPFLNINGLANVNHISFCVMEIVDTCFGGQLIKLLLRQVRWENCFSGVSFQRLNDYALCVPLQEDVEDLRCGLCVSAGAVTIRYGDAQAFSESSQAVRIQ